MRELDEHYTLEDVLDANEALDVYIDTNDPKAEPPSSSAGGKIGIVVSSKGKGRR